MLELQGTFAPRVKPPLLARMAAAPRAVGRATRRWSYAAGLTSNIASALRRLEQLQRDGADADEERLLFQRWLANNVCAIHGVEVSATGCLAALDRCGPMVVVANHISYLDPVAILSRISAFAVAKREVARWPLVGSLATQLGMVPYTRGDVFDGARVLRRCERHLRGGYSVLAFPEGTTTRGHRVAPLHGGVFFLAHHCRVPVVPIALRYDCEEAAWVGDQPFVPHYMRTAARPVTRVVMEVLRPMESLGSETPGELCERVGQCLRGGLERVRARSLARPLLRSEAFPVGQIVGPRFGS